MSKQNRNPEFVNKVMFTFLVTPAVPAVIFASVFSIGWYTKTASDRVPLFGGLFLFAYLVAGAHTLILGVPAFLLGKWFNAIRWWTCVPVAFLIGSLPMAILGQAGWSAFTSWGLFGAIGGLAFWLLWRFYIRSEKTVETLDNVPSKATPEKTHP
jgi:hypothetical protein